MKGPKDRVIYTSTQGIQALQVSSATFYRHVRKLGMRPRRKYKSNARWWTYDDLLRLLNSVYRPSKSGRTCSSECVRARGRQKEVALLPHSESSRAYWHALVEKKTTAPFSALAISLTTLRASTAGGMKDTDE